ncbi:tRNA nuclease WapA precursor [Planctomycetes bacterium CA13]|uniref:tRNA nuclease WapA n=1 Tax=Novipirellula herctigrandis TaxID=2527986 RepID=A0A5C5ZB71_9BACT|nr:tRNA nuclease WapA precursor [Planctomycetes bacterium CA13]
MPRIKRADEAGCIYHALNRGNAKNGKVRKLTPFPFYFPVSYTYDEAGRKSTESTTLGGQTYTTTTNYDDLSQVSGLTYPDGTPVVRTYTDRGQLETVAFNNTTVDTRTYDDGGRMTGSSYSNGVSESRTYNADNTLAGIAFSGAPIGDLTYGWDANKNKTSETITGTMGGYGFNVGTSGYDDEDRLVNWNRTDSNLDQAWNLSLVGDWNSFTENASVLSRTHGPTHEILSAAGQAVQHDAKGNQTLLPTSLSPLATSLSLHWDFENKLLGADTDNDGTDDATYQFDALGRRVARDDGTTVSVYVQNGQQTIADYVSGSVPGSPTYTYAYGSYIDEPVIRGGTGGLRYYHRNQQYSIIALTDGGGLIKERYAYDAYGTPTILDSSLSALATSLSSNRYTYTGREWDEALGLYHYRARMYDSASGRFCSRDPIGYEGSKWNLYEYVESRPVSNTDPSGMFSWRSCRKFCKNLATRVAVKCDKACRAICPKQLKPNSTCHIACVAEAAGIFATCVIGCNGPNPFPWDLPF